MGKITGVLMFILAIGSVLLFDSGERVMRELSILTAATN